MRLPSHHAGLSLFLRHLPPPPDVPPRGVVLYVHGATFPSALSIAHRFDGRSWRDVLSAAGFHVWGLDFLGYGESDRYPAMSRPAAGAPLCGAEDGSRQIETAVQAIAAQHQVSRLAIVAHSWGTIAAGRFAARCPAMVDRLVFFGGIARREPSGSMPAFPAWRGVSLRDQWQRFTADVPSAEQPVLSRRHFDSWGEAYLATDPLSRATDPAAVRTPSGPWFDIARAHHGDLAYDPAAITAPVALIRGEWDTLCSAADAAWLFRALRNAPIRRDITLSRGTHLMHLESGRYALYRETVAFLTGGDVAPHADKEGGDDVCRDL